MKRIAAHILEVDGMQIAPVVVEVEGRYVTRYYKLTSELPCTEWLGGKFSLEAETNGSLRLIHCGRWLKEK